MGYLASTAEKMALLSLDIVATNVCMQRKCPHKVFAWQAVLELLSSSHPAFLDEMSARYSTIQSAAAGKGKKVKKAVSATLPRTTYSHLYSTLCNAELGDVDFCRRVKTRSQMKYLLILLPFSEACESGSIAA